ncbi:remodeling and spacing factor 1 isoform X2 [Plodia interpunctella]|uniref:remodeling and spacing factor 1 isoform X2 n=1 Tax=Plodia interpunctella TaxID=58824 RepID=UPI00236895C1|nr:remodeling and spacing factor 1 isoform X2 [Plodia interpunctella]
MASDSEISCSNDPNFAVIYSFLKVFGKLYGLDVPTIAKLQEFIENTQEVLDPLKEIHLRLLRRALKSVQSNKWERSLIKFCHQHGHHQEAWEMERFSYKKASPQVKLKVLKLLLEYQFTCHPKFKSAVNALSCKDLRLDPIGRDKNGCVYWYQVDDDANLCLYKEDQDEETWQVVARNREELVKVIAQLKNGEEVCPLVSSTTNEDSSSAEIPPQKEAKPEEDEENEEEFLSPESESEHEVESQEKSKNTDKVEQTDTTDPEEIVEARKEETKEGSLEQKELKEEISININNSNPEKSPLPENPENNLDKENLNNDDSVEDNKKEENETVSETIEEPVMIVTGEGNGADCESFFNIDTKIRENTTYFYENNIRNLESFEKEISLSESVSEAIEEPLMFITGESNGEDCDSPYIIGEEITEEIMYFFGEGSGYDNDTGNPEVIEHEHSAAEENTDAENGNEECINGEHDVPNNSNVTNNSKVVKSVKLKSGVTSVNKRTLKKQNNDNTEVLKSEPKKPCVRSVDSTESTNSTKSAESATDSREGSVNDKSTTDNDTPRKNNVKKGKVKKKRELGNKLKFNEGKEVLNSVTESDNCHDSKASIIEKRKSSVSSVEEHDHIENENEKSPEKEVKVEDPLPPKKLRLDTPESDVPGSICNETIDSKNTIVNDKKNDSKLKSKAEDVENSVSQRKKIKANKGKFKRKRILKIKADNDAEKEDSDNNVSIKEKKANKSLKRTLLDATMSDKNKSESQSESEEDEPVTSGKRLKIKPKKIITSSRKKVEAKLRENHSSDESEEETLYSIGKKSPKKVLKRKPKGKEKEKKKDVKGESGAKSSESDAAPVRQSRRIAQMKIKEEADRRHLEEVALREMKMIHKKKNKDDDEEEWQASGSSSEGEKEKARRKGKDKWRGGDSTGPDQDSESDEPLFDLHDEPDPIDNTKSDHEFSPESDLENGEPVEPLKRVRTLQEGKEDGVCARCGSGEQPEWILLCDQCDAGYHASCLKPMLFLVPEGDWYCPPCNHDMLIVSLEKELTKFDELLVQVEAERERKKLEEPEKQSASDDEKKENEDTEDKSHSDGESSSGWSSSSGAVYRLRARRQLPVSYRSQEYDRLISSAIKEEYVEPTTSAGNQGRGKDISTIIEAAEEEKMKAEREALEQGKPLEVKKARKKSRRKPRKLNSLDVPSEDDDTDEDFKETGVESSSEDISSSAERGSSSDSRSSDDLPIRRTARTDKKDRPKLAESSPEVKKKKKGVFTDSSSESADGKEWSKKEEKKSKSKSRPKRDKSSKKSRKRSGLTQYDAAGNVVRARVTYGGLSDEGPNDWSPKHRTRQKKINYTEMPNTESEDEMHKSSGKHMPDSSDEFKVDDSDLTSDSDAERKRNKSDTEEKQRALNDLICKTAVVPLEKLPEDITKAKTEQLEEHLKAQQECARGGRGGRGGRGTRGTRGRARGGRGRAHNTDDALAKLVGVKIKDLKTDGSPMKPNDIERAKKRQEREAKQAEKEARRVERLQKKEEKEKLKEQKAKEREEKKLARIALQESKRMKKEKVEFPAAGGFASAPRPPLPHDFQEQRFPAQPRLQVRAELRGVAGPEERLHAVSALREGTLSVAGSPQPFKPVSEEPSIITRMPHMINQQYRGPMMYPGGNSPYGPRAQNMMYPMHHPGMNPARHQYPGGYYPPQMRALPPGYPPAPGVAAPHPPSPHAHPLHAPLRQPMMGPPAHHALPALHRPPGPSSHPHAGPAPHASPGAHAGPGPHVGPGPHAGPGHHAVPGPHAGPGPHGGLGPHAGPGPHASPGPHGSLGPHAGPGPHLGPGPHIGPGPHAGPGPHTGPGPHVGPAPHAPNSPSPLAAGPSPLRPTATPPATSSAPSTPSSTPGPAPEPAIKIKAEVKTEPEYRTPPASPRPPSPRDEPPRHPKIKHTENKDRRPRFPLGPYAPQYGPYGPYAPPDGHAMPARPGQHPLQRMQQLQRLLPDERARPPHPPHPPRPDLTFLSAHLRSQRPPYFPPPSSSPQYSSPYADPTRTALGKQLAAPMMPQQRERLERLSSPPSRGAPTPPGAAAAPPPTSPADPPREDRRPPSVPRDGVAPPYLKPNDGATPPYMKPSDMAVPPYLKQSDGAGQPYLKPTDTAVPPYLKPSDAAAPPYLKASDASAPPYLKPSDAGAPPYLKPSDAGAPPYLKPSDAAAPPYLRPSDTSAQPYLKPSDTAAPPYLKTNNAAAPPYLKPSDTAEPPYLKESEAAASSYPPPPVAATPSYPPPHEELPPPYLKPPPAVDKAPVIKTEEREEGSVFGGLVSYFSSQSQDDIDA